MKVCFCFLISNSTVRVLISSKPMFVGIYRGYWFILVKDRKLFHRVDTIGNIFTSGAAMSENITDNVHEMK